MTSFFQNPKKGVLVVPCHRLPECAHTSSRLRWIILSVIIFLAVVPNERFTLLIPLSSSDVRLDIDNAIVCRWCIIWAHLSCGQLIQRFAHYIACDAS